MVGAPSPPAPRTTIPPLAALLALWISPSAMKSAPVSFAAAVVLLTLGLFQTSCLHWPGPMPGSHAPALVSDPDVRAAAHAACRAQSVRPLAILEASRQVVAGTNYRLRLRVVERGQERKATADVFVSLQGQASLSSWTWD